MSCSMLCQNVIILGGPIVIMKQANLQVVLKRAADLAEALYAMPRGGLGGRADSYSNYTSQLAAIQHEHGTATGYPGEVDDYTR